MKQKHSAFTLIELLIVVAIIAILAAIAVPNFLEAQTRAKVSRAKSDLRTLVTGIEAYAVDHNNPPREYIAAIDGPFFGETNSSGIMSPLLSTPIAYVTNAFVLDPFVRAGDAMREDEKYITYHNIIFRERTNRPFFYTGSGSTTQQTYDNLKEAFGFYYLICVGPERNWFNNTPGVRSRAGVVGREYIQYDPTNGTLSPGNIMRSQKHGFDHQPPADGVVLGPH